MGRQQCKSTFNNTKSNNMSAPEPSGSTTRPKYTKSEENNLENSFMKMVYGLKVGIKNCLKEIEEKTNKKLEDICKSL